MRVVGRSTRSHCRRKNDGGSGRRAKSQGRSHSIASINRKCGSYSSARAKSACRRCAHCKKSEAELVGVVTQPDKPAGRTQKITAPPIKKALIGSGLNANPVQDSPRRAGIFQPARIKDPEAIDQIRALAPDVIVVMAYGQILPRAVLEIPKIACLNLHASLLPRWRGAAP